MNMKRPLIALTIALVAMVTFFVGLALAQGPDIDLDANQEDIRVIGANELDWMGEVTASGDVNGDGYEDLIVGASTADVNHSNQDDRGAVYVILGRPTLDPTWHVDTAPTNLTFYGANDSDVLGHSVSSGDLNGDGLSDIVMGADGYGGGTTTGDGAVYVFLGRTSLTTTTQTVVYLDAPGSNPPSLIVYGYGLQRLGRSVFAGDVNDDGYDDLILGGYHADPAGRINAGAAYIILGGSHLTTSASITVNLGIQNADLTILGAEDGDYLGRSVSSGDINGDGYADVIAGAQYADSPVTDNVGLVYVIPGSASITTTTPITYDLSTITDTAQVASYYGVADDDETGFYVAAGNINGDTYDDVIIAAYRADAYWPGSETGKVYVAYGQATLSTGVYLSTQADITIYGAEDDERLGRSVASGDINNDATYEDIIIGASWANRDGIADTGRVYVISGGPSLSATINLSETLSADVRIQGDDGVPPGYYYDSDGPGPQPGRWYGDECGRSVSVGDINGDGAQDVIIGAVWAEDAAGEVYVIYGGGPITLSLSPTGQTVASGQSVTYTITASNSANVRNVSAKTIFAIDDSAGGAWNSNVYTAGVAGTWAITATYQGVVTVTTLTVTNQPPIAQTSGPAGGNEGTALAFDGSGSSDPENAPLSYAWDLDNDGQFDDSASVNPSYTWFDEGTYTVTLRVTDSGGLTDTDSLSVTINNVAPGITQVGHSLPTDEGTAITITITASDPGNDTLSYGFDWDGNGLFTDPGDIAGQAANQASHTWNTQGSYSITLRVDDGDGGVVTTTSSLTVNDTNPTADFAATPTSGDEPLTVNFSDASTSYDGIVAWAWDLNGDGATDATVANPSFQYTASGVYTVSLTVQETDSDADTETKVSYITVGDTDPQANFTATPTSGDAPLRVNFSDASTSYDGIIAWAWDLNGDGATDATVANPNFQYTISGVYTVSLTVQEADGDADTETKVSYITVNEIPPPALHHFALDLPASAEAGQPFTVTITAIDQYGNPYTAFNGAVSLSTDAGSIVPNGVALSSGVWTGQVRLTKPGPRTIYVNGSQGQGTLTVTNYRILLPIVFRSR